MILVKLILIIVAMCFIWTIVVIFREKDDIYEEASVDYPELVTVGLVIMMTALGIAATVLITVAVMI